MARLNREIAYLEAFSRRENLLFEGINEVSVEGENYEDTASALRTFLSNIVTALRRLSFNESTA